MVTKRKYLLVGMITVLILMQTDFLAFASGGYTLPGSDFGSNSAEPSQSDASALQSSADASSNAASSAQSPGYTIPDTDSEGTSAESTQSDTSASKPSVGTPSYTAKPEASSAPADSKSMSDSDYLNAITLAFIDGISELTPTGSDVTVTAAMVRVPEKRIGSAQWFINGVSQSDYYSNDFTIYNGRITALELSIPFSREIENGEITIALELRLNAAARRIEKRIKITNYDESWYDNQEIARVFEIVKPVEIEATLKHWTNTYTSSNLGNKNGSLDKGSIVYYMDHAGDYAAHVWIPEESRACWVPYYSISISDKDYTVYEDFSDSDKEIFVNAKEYESRTDYLIWINLQRQRVNVFQGTKGNWDLVRVFTCSSGKNTTPTPAGVMTYCAYDNGWYHDTYYVKPVLYLNVTRGIALHSILFNPNGSVQDGTQGTPVSHGCIRMMPEDIKWIANFVPIDTTVAVF